MILAVVAVAVAVVAVAVTPPKKNVKLDYVKTQNNFLFEINHKILY
jgi:hypothetical protein